MNLAPIVLFCYKRLDVLKKTVDALKTNSLASYSHLIIFSDGPKSEVDIHDINLLREYIFSIEGFGKISVNTSDLNIGLANSIIYGVTKVLNEYGKVIVLEDDLVTSVNFLSYMNQALNIFQHNQKIFSISGFSMLINGLEYFDIYFTQRASSWGWATWKDRWDPIDWDVNDYESFIKNKRTRIHFNKMGSDMSSMLTRQMTGKINSWAIRWCYHQFKHELFTVYPATSKVLNIGLENPEATHTNERFNRFKTVLDITGNEVFNFRNIVQLDKAIIPQFTKPYSISERIKYRILNLILSR